MKVIHLSKQNIKEQNMTVMHFCRIRSNFHKMSAGFCTLKCLLLKMFMEIGHYAHY